MLAGCKISAIAHSLPDTIMTNEDIIKENKLRLNPEWVRLNIGIVERRWCKDDIKASDLAADVLTQLISKSELPVSEIDGLILSTVSSDQMTPSTASVVQCVATPGETYPCFDITAACSGFLYALDVGRRYVQTGKSNMFCIASETRSHYLNKQDRRTVMLFGDGAAGVYLSPCEEGEIGIIYSNTVGDGRYWEAITVPHGGTILMKEAALIFEMAISEMCSLVNAALEECELSLDNIDYFIFHQASALIVDKVAEKLDISSDKYFKNFSTRGNITSASVPLALSEAVDEKKIKHGDMVCLLATGGGFSAGISILRWEI